MSNLDFEIFDNIGRDDLDIIYLGTKLRVPLWEMVLLASPGIHEMGGLIQTDHTQDSMIMSADYGMILKMGDHCYEEVGNPYKTGQWVSFEEFHPQSRRINGVLIYFIADSRIMAEQAELETWDCYLLFEEKLKKLREHAAEWRSMSREDRLKNAGRVVTLD